MPWIKVMSDEEATGETADYYQKIREQRGQERASGGPPGLASLSPKAMWHAAELMWEVMNGPSGLTPAQREMVATVTSLTTNCRY